MVGFTALVTPSADVISMCLLALPMLGLYFGAAGIAAVHDRRATRRAAIAVESLVEEPLGAYPTGCVGLYPADAAHLERYLSLAENGREAEYLEGVIRASRRQAELAKEAA